MNEATFEKQIFSLKDKLFRLAKRMLFDIQAAEDATQDVLIKLWQKRDTLGRYRNIEVVAFTAVRNKCLDEIKKNKRRQTHYNTNGIAVMNSQRPLEAQVDARNQVDIMETIMDDLPENQRSILQLRDVEGLEYDEIAEVLEMNNGAVRTNLSRARKKVREELVKQIKYGLEQS